MNCHVELISSLLDLRIVLGMDPIAAGKNRFPYFVVKNQAPQLAGTWLHYRAFNLTFSLLFFSSRFHAQKRERTKNKQLGIVKERPLFPVQRGAEKWRVSHTPNGLLLHLLTNLFSFPRKRERGFRFVGTNQEPQTACPICLQTD